MPKRLKIAYYVQRFPYLTETFILREMLYLREIGFDVEVISLMPPIPNSKVHPQVQQMMPFVHYSPVFLSWGLIGAQFYFFFRHPLRYLRALQRAIWQTYAEPMDLLKMLINFPKSVYFARQLQGMQVDHIHAHFVSLSAISAQIAADLIGVSYSVHAHAYDIFSRNLDNVRRQLELVTAIVTVSEYHRQYIAKLCPHWEPEDIQVVHYGVDPAEFTRGKVAANGSMINIISVGSLLEKKGHEILIDACAQLAAKGYSFQCNIVGNGYLRESLQARIDSLGLQETVFLVGAKNQLEVQDLYLESDIFVLACVIAKSGDRDGMPNVLLEAMAMELPVITTPVTGNVELVHHQKNGWLVPSHDASALASAIEALIKDPDLRERLGKEGRQTILAEFDIHKTVTQMAAIFDETVKNSSRSK